MPRSRKAEPTDLNPTFERLVATIGHRIGRKLAIALTEVPQERARPRRGREKSVCASADCDRFAVAKGLCKSHYNLMLYHRRKASAASRTKKTTSRRGGKSGHDA